MSTSNQPSSPPHNPADSVAPAHPPLKRDSRRAFLFKLSLALNGAVGAVLAVPILGYLLGPALKRDKDYNAWVSLGSADQFPEGETRLVDYRNPVTTDSDGATGNVACWVRHIQGKQFQVFAINCAHLGCPVRWFAQSQLFMCPCHGGAYYADGARASGPPERGLFEYQYSIVNSNLMINAGEMPTLSNQACNQKPLIQIEPHPASDKARQDSSKARSSQWPA
ncbi:MAG: Rieske 2Fe-2S domain-containing protein [Terracidiphilus sp.]